jgi:ABC-type branched-subunit amino acid transport system ATPase component
MVKSSEHILECRAVVVRFGGLFAIKGVDLRVANGTVHSLVGPNGAGKTTLINGITGFVPISGGDITFNEIQIGRLSSNRIASLGVARTFQNIRLFPNMSVLENVLVGAHRLFKGSFFQLQFRRGAAREEERTQISKALSLLDFVGIGAAISRSPSTLPYGHQRRLEIARALALEPKLLLLDEPMAGMNSAEKDELIVLIRRIRDRDVTIVLIEHDVDAVRKLSDRVSVLHHGEKIADDVPKKVFADPVVEQAYLARSVL